MAISISSKIGYDVDILYIRYMAKEAISTTAKVIELLPADHNSVRYEYSVSGILFQGVSRSRPPNSCHPLVGQPAIAYYDPKNPGKSFLGDPKKIFKNEMKAILITALFMPIVGIAIFNSGRRRKKIERIRVNPDHTA